MGFRVLEKETQEFIGISGLKILDPTGEIEVGYLFERKHWGKGFATEATKALIKYGFKNIEIEKKIDEGIPLVKDLGLERILTNVLRNAVESIEDNSGKITIEAKHQQDTLHIKIRDTGVGIASGETEKIFEPFYTTKAINKGSGLGLTIVSEIVKGYNGRIAVESDPGKQTTFFIDLPLQ